MKTIILAGGFGTRISEFTDKIPKPMITIGNMPILWHILKFYSNYGIKDFGIALGYKSEVIKNFFLNYSHLNSDFTINLSSGNITTHSISKDNWNVSLIDTGLNSMTGGRVKRMKEYIGKDEPFLLTYGDGLSNVNINELLKFHKSNNKMVTVTAVRPSARFGEMKIDKNNVTVFKEKPQTNSGWINGGFFVCNPEFLDFIDGDHTILERDPLERLVALNQLAAYKHDGFWQCMDNKRDYDLLNKMYEDNNIPWLKL
jgi:glucose-1-phosphate cytidylyltransferase